MAPGRPGPVNVQFSGDIPKNYDAHLGPLFFEPFSKLIAERVAAWNPADLLELSCGTGRLTRQLAQKLDSRTRLLATDINPAMLAHARQTGADRDIEWGTIDAVHLPYPDQCFDLVVVQFGVMFYADRSKAYSEALRVLRPGGRLIFTSWDHINHNPVARITQEVVQHFFPTDTPAFYTVPFAYHDKDLIREEVLTAGFGRVRLDLLQPLGHATSAASATMGLLEGVPLLTAILDRDPALLPVMKTELTARLAGQYGTGAFHVPLSAWAVEATK